VPHFILVISFMIPLYWIEIYIVYIFINLKHREEEEEEKSLC